MLVSGPPAGKAQIWDEGVLVRQTGHEATTAPPRQL